MYKRLIYFLIVIFSSCTLANQSDIFPPARSAQQIIRSAMEQWRGENSKAKMTMIIHRADWQREMTMLAWTQGDKKSLVRVESPRKDKGSATLTDDNQMWTFSPKINRVIRIPSSMMSQSWMGGDFSNNDISKSTDVIDDYQHSLTKIAKVDGHKIYTITSIPHDDAPVVWGKEVFKVRDDYVLLEQQFWDQENVLVKTLTTTEIKTFDGRAIASTIRMSKTDNPDEWTEMITLDVKFNIDISDRIFTLSNLRNPRQ
ncbi:MAG: outer membrane lipoprotein-sorting protein [Moritella sp.]|uniref:outer membrane lipoprotein-sorting protein n=1 Tax=Moritella sp. TaxID=78556 RepID=UPI0029AB6C8D|nr:outer membrane lipoprotein-sorting protein [Moritella sp.]MDX2321438.1 outer membrane lipoprotein-sorting protein [Moritella sp.]